METRVFQIGEKRGRDEVAQGGPPIQPQSTTRAWEKRTPNVQHIAHFDKHVSSARARVEWVLDIVYRQFLLGWTQEEIGASIGITRQSMDAKFLQVNGKNEKLPVSCQKSVSGLPANSEFGYTQEEI